MILDVKWLVYSREYVVASNIVLVYLLELLFCSQNVGVISSKPGRACTAVRMDHVPLFYTCACGCVGVFHSTPR